MWKKIAIAGGACAVVVGIGTAALATSGSSPSPGTPSPSPSSSSASPTAGKHHARNALRRALHGQWVTRDKDGSGFVTHDAIRGKVTAVSATSITVQSADNKSETYIVSSDTKVRIRADGNAAKGTKGAISQVHTGDEAVVVGTGTGTLTARGVIAGGK